MNFHFFRKVRDIETGRVLNHCGMLPSFHMDCGPSNAETSAANNASSLAGTFSSDASSRFANQSEILSSLQNSLTPILSGGPSQEGFSAAEKAALNTQAINASGAANKNAQQAAANFGASRGDSTLTSGVQKQIQAGVASNSAGQLASAQNSIVQQDYSAGNRNYWATQGALGALGNSEDSSQFATLANGATQNAFSDQDTVSNEKNAEAGQIAGGVAGLAGAFAGTNFAGGLGGGKIFGSGGALG